MNKEYTSNTSKRNTYLSPLALLILFYSLLLSSILTLLYIALTTQDKGLAVLVSLGCAICLSSLYVTRRKLTANSQTQAYIETKSKQAE